MRPVRNTRRTAMKRMLFAWKSRSSATRNEGRKPVPTEEERLLIAPVDSHHMDIPTDENLLSFDATPGAAKTINEWISCGHAVSVITGRPSGVYESSRIWLDEHGLKNARLYCLNKYGRDHFIKNSNSTLELEDYYRMKFDFAIEDSPKAFMFFEHLPELKVLVFDRPWNRECAFPNGNYQRCTDWENIRRIVAGG